MNPPGARVPRSLLVLGAGFLVLLLLGMRPVLAQGSTNSSFVSAPNGVSFDFATAAVASLVIVLLGLTSVLVILAKYMERIRQQERIGFGSSE